MILPSVFVEHFDSVKSDRKILIELRLVLNTFFNYD